MHNSTQASHFRSWKNFKSTAIRVSALARVILASDENYLDNVLELYQIDNRLLGEIRDTEFHVFGVSQ